VTSCETGLLCVGTGHVAPSSLQITKYHAQMPQTSPAPPLIRLPLFVETVSPCTRPTCDSSAHSFSSGWTRTVVRSRGIGTAGQRRLDPYPDPGVAINAQASLLGRQAPAATIKSGRHETAPLGGRGLRYAFPIADLAVSR
jgi:hypothetical protein